MDQLLEYLNGLAPDEQQRFAQRCGTSVGYLRKAASKGQKLGVELSAKIEANSFRAVSAKKLRPDVDWGLVKEAAA